MPALVDRCLALIASERGLDPRLRTCPAAPPGDTGAAASRDLAFELTSRGDHVPGWLWRPATDERAPLVLLQYGAGGAVDDAHRRAVVPFVEAGLSVATVDWPLHGARRSPKLSERLIAALGGGGGAGGVAGGGGVGGGGGAGDDPNGAALAEQFALQALLDLARAVEALAGTPGVDVARVGVVGVGLGASLLAGFARVEPRVGALVLAPDPGAAPSPGLDPKALLADATPRPTLLLAATRSPDEAWPAAVDEFAAACPGGAEIERTPAGAVPLGPEAAAAAARFLADALD